MVLNASEVRESCCSTQYNWVPWKPCDLSHTCDAKIYLKLPVRNKYLLKFISHFVYSVYDKTLFFLDYFNKLYFKIVLWNVLEWSLK